MSDRPADYQSLQDELLHEFPDLRALWDKTYLKRLLGIFLARMRKFVGLSQRDVAEIAGWDKAFVSRLEGIDAGGVPDLQTIARYATACKMDVGIVVCNRGGVGQHVQVIDAISLNCAAPDAKEGRSVFDTLRDRKLEIQ